MIIVTPVFTEDSFRIIVIVIVVVIAIVFFDYDYNYDNDYRLPAIIALPFMPSDVALLNSVCVIILSKPSP